MNTDRLIADITRAWPAAMRAAPSDEVTNLISQVEISMDSSVRDVTGALQKLNALHPEFEATVHFAVDLAPPKAFLEYRKRRLEDFVPEFLRRS